MRGLRKALGGGKRAEAQTASAPSIGAPSGGAGLANRVANTAVRRQVHATDGAPDARGGILEPSGAIAIKYRTAARLATARRLDPTLQALHSALAKVEARQNDAGPSTKLPTAEPRDTIAMNAPDFYNESALRCTAHSYCDTAVRPGFRDSSFVALGCSAIIPLPRDRHRAGRGLVPRGVRGRAALADAPAARRHPQTGLPSAAGLGGMVAEDGNGDGGAGGTLTFPLASHSAETALLACAAHGVHVSRCAAPGGVLARRTLDEPSPENI